MKRHALWNLLGTGLLAVAIANPAHAAPKEEDAIEKGLRDAYKQYQQKNYSEVTEQLRAIIKLLEEKNIKRVEVVLPVVVDGWRGGDLARENLDIVGGGLSMKRTYTKGGKSITVKIVKDSPLADQWMKLLANEDLVKLSGKKTHNISGEQGIMDNERKLVAVIDDEILLEVLGDSKCKEPDVVGLARKLDLRLMKKMK